MTCHVCKGSRQMVATEARGTSQAGTSEGAIVPCRYCGQKWRDLPGRVTAVLLADEWDGVLRRLADD